MSISDWPVVDPSSSMSLKSLIIASVLASWGINFALIARYSVLLAGHSSTAIEKWVTSNTLKKATFIQGRIQYLAILEIFLALTLHFTNWFAEWEFNSSLNSESI